VDRGASSVADLAVIGLGYVGLPLAREAARAGLEVVGFDISTVVVNALNKGVSHVDDVSDTDVSTMLEAGFCATTDAADLARADTVVICVPTPLTEEDGPDLGPVRAAARVVARHLRQDTLVVLESTTYPGTTDEVLAPILEESGLRAGVDFNLAFSPERVDPGNLTFGLRNTPKVVGGYSAACTQRAAAFYGKFVETVVTARGTREAETAKLLENTYRHVNIALVNEMARFCHELEIDLWDVIGLAATKPFGFQAFYPGPGVGGHCIPIDPNYLSHSVQVRLGYPFRFVQLAQEINASMPLYVAQRAQDILNSEAKAVNGSTVLLLGVTYKPNIADLRESPAVPLAKRLERLGAVVVFHDPYVTDWQAGDRILDRVPDLDDALRSADLTILLQRHSDYDVASIAATARRVLDTRGEMPVSPTVERL
jgi:UDP-N-acetyl-D-glucosamine dehydrogenase